MFDRPSIAAPCLFLTRRCLIVLGAVFLALTAPSSASAAQFGGQGSGATKKVDQPIEQLIEAIENPQTRIRLVAALRVAAAAPPAAAARDGAAAADAPEGAVSWSIHTVEADLLDILSHGITWFGDALRAGRTATSDPAALIVSIESRLASPDLRELAAGSLLALTLCLAAGFGADLAVGWSLAGVRRRTVATRRRGLRQRAVGASALLAIELLRLTALAAAAYAVLALAQPAPVARLCVLVVVDALIFDRAARSVARATLGPMHPSLRLLRVGDEAAAYLYIWVRRLTVVGVYGYFALQGALLLGLAASAYAFGVKALGLLIAAMLALFIMQNRRPVARFLAPAATPEPAGAWSTLRRRLAETWHVFALLYLIAAYVVWASEVPGGFAYLARAALSTAVILGFARAAAATTQRGLTRLLHVNRELLTRNPLVEARANRYGPAFRRAIAGAIWFAAGLAVLAAWQVDVAAFFADTLVARVVARLVAAAIVFVVALAIWEVTDLVITMYLERKDENGSAVIRSARTRTLLPLVRNALLIVILLFALLTGLSQIGVNTAPLLAGAGVVGLAVGFGSQTLVKDVITGAFILFEDTVSVGDVASINSTSGVVEAITIRTIRLRDLAGTVHTIPFGSINAISNMTKEYSMYLLDIGVAYKENTDRVIAAMREVFTDIAADPAYANDIIGDLEVLGVDRFADSAVYIRARIKTLPSRQWNVGREYNRRIKQKFDALGIEIPFPHQKIYFGEPAAGAAAMTIAEPRRALAAPAS
jgi:moderate conductance mechanosensitive channel